MNRLSFPIASRLVLIVLGALALTLAGCAETKALRERTELQEKEIIRLRKEKDEFREAYYKTKETYESEMAKSEKSLELTQRERDDAKNLRTKQERELDEQLRARTLEMEAAKNLAAEQKKMLDAQIAQLSQGLQQTTAERDAALGRLTETETKLADEQKRTAELTQQVAGLTVEAQTLNTRIEGLTKDIAEREAALGAEKEGRAAADKRAQDLEAQLAAAQQSLADTQRQAAETKKQLDESTQAVAELKKLQEERTQLASQLESLKADQTKALEAAKTAAAQEAQAKRPSLTGDAELQQASQSLEAKLKAGPIAGAEVRLADRGLRIILPSDSLFEKESVTLASGAGEGLAPVAEALKGLAGREIAVEGHTDDQPIGDLPYADNWGLGFARADRVRNWLMKEGGVPGAGLTALTRAQFNPLGDGKDRRVEIVVGAKSE